MQTITSFIVCILQLTKCQLYEKPMNPLGRYRQKVGQAQHPSVKVDIRFHALYDPCGGFDQIRMGKYKFVIHKD